MFTITKPVDEHFFEQESKEMWYVIGASYCRYSASRTDNRNSWRSVNYDLLGIIQTCVDPNQAIGTPDKFGSRLLQIKSQHMQDRLKKKGLGVPRSERGFPADIKNRYLDYFVRGFFDAQVSVSADERTCVSYPSANFLRGLYKKLVTHAHVRTGRDITSTVLCLSQQETAAVHDFIYRDWEYIQEHGLYLPSKKERFKVA